MLKPHSEKEPFTKDEQNQIVPRTVPRACKPLRSLVHSPEWPYRKYDAMEDGLRNVGKVVPALLSDDGVSVDAVTDHRHLLVAVTTLASQEGHILVCDRGWMPLSNLDSYEEVGDRTNSRGWTVKFEYSTSARAVMRCLRLSSQDKRKIVAAILTHYMGAMDPGQQHAARYRPC